MASDRWGYDPRAHRYRDLTSGRFLPKATITRLRDDALDTLGARATGLATRAAAGDLSPAAFRSEMRALIKTSHVLQATFGRGGVNAMTAADWGRVGAAVRGQYGYLDGFVRAIEGGELSEAQAAVRARMYTDGAVQSYERAWASAWGIALPAYPADGGTPCLSNCRCRWDIEDHDAEVHAFWRTSAGEVCSGCQDRAARWSPYVAPAGPSTPASRPVRLTWARP